MTSNTVPLLLPSLFEEYEEDEELTLTSFDGQRFPVPDRNKFKRCRSVNDFKKIANFSEGGFGSVYKGVDMKSGDVVALKKLKIMKNEAVPQSVIREIFALKSLNHINVLKILDVAVGKNMESIYLVLEFCLYSLSGVIDAKVTLELTQIKCVMNQLFRGLDHIHEHAIIHRDLTVSNIIFNHVGTLKIADFGSSRRETTGKMTPNISVRWYSAPELLFGATTYTCAIDMWSSGLIMAEMLLRKPLFRAESDMDMIEQIVECLGTPSENIWPGFSSLPIPQICKLKSQPCNNLKSYFEGRPPSCIAILHKLFTYDPKTRISAKDCLNHAFFSEYPMPCQPNNLIPILEASLERMNILDVQ